MQGSALAIKILVSGNFPRRATLRKRASSSRPWPATHLTSAEPVASPIKVPHYAMRRHAVEVEHSMDAFAPTRGYRLFAPLPIVAAIVLVGCESGNSGHAAFTPKRGEQPMEPLEPAQPIEPTEPMHPVSTVPLGPTDRMARQPPG